MNFKLIKELIHNNINHYKNKNLHSAITIPLVEIEDNIHILFEKRASHLKRQPNEICFPGGKIESNETPLDAAIRETCEEIGIESTLIEFIDTMPLYVNDFGIVIHPYIVRLHIDSISSINPNPDEVSKVFTVPIQYFIENPPEQYTITKKLTFDEDFPFDLIPNGKNYNWRSSKGTVLFYKYHNITIWGITAQLTNQFIHIIK